LNALKLKITSCSFCLIKKNPKIKATKAMLLKAGPIGQQYFIDGFDVMTIIDRPGLLIAPVKINRHF